MARPAPFGHDGVASQQREIPMTSRRRLPLRRVRITATVLGALLAATIGAGRSRTPIAAAGDPAPAEDLVAVEAAWKRIEKPAEADYRAFLARFRAAKGGEGRARELAAVLLAKFDPDDAAAHAALGHREFTFEVPEEISYRRYPFVRIVDEALEKRWFDDLEPYAAALGAYAKCTAHAKRLADDPAYAALDVARRGIDRDPHLHAYNYDAIFASPYLICYTTKERIDEAALWNMAPAAKARAWAELDARRTGYKRVLAEKARIYTQMYREFLKRYGAACDLKPLMDPFGGRPDLPPATRSYREGCPLIVWIFADQAAWTEFHETVKGERLDDVVLGYHDSRTGVVYAYDHAPEERDVELSVNTRIATLQLLHWFTKQRNEWGRPQSQLNWFTAGFPSWLGAVTMAKDRSLRFTGLSRPHLEPLEEIKSELAHAGKKMFVFPLRELVGLEGREKIRSFGVQRWGIAQPIVERLYRLECWAVVQFLQEGAEGKYRAGFDRVVNDMLSPPRDHEGYAGERFQRAYAIESDDDWKRMQREFDVYFDALLKLDPTALGPKPPALDDWPDYVAPDLEAPTGPLPGK
jgi:hypothetical protein